MNNSKKEEYLLTPEKNRYNVFPIRNQEIWNLYKVMQAANWTAEEIDWSKDKYDFEELDLNSQKFIKYVLGFFSTSDIIVNMNIGDQLLERIEPLEAKIAYQFQVMIENVHSETYSLQIDNIIKDPKEKEEIFNAINEVPCIKAKSNWMMKWASDNEASIGKRLIAQVISEGLFFQGSFAAIFWLKQKGGIMPGLISSNELIARDEGLHTDFSILLYSMVENKLEKEEIHQMFSEAVEIEKIFICESLPCSLLGMNAELMEKFIKFTADSLLVKLKMPKLYNESNPFDWMEMISLEGKTNFFESRPSQYQSASVLNKNPEFNIDDDDF